MIISRDWNQTEMAEVCHSDGQKRDVKFNDLCEWKEVKEEKSMCEKLSVKPEALKFFSMSSI